ncbi:TlpA family protein disulfide reductase [Streptomyces sp. NPDC057638]|uniref:TlpA family protein disulfide reductase n=1 Tax=Streptomyces sp. NPDC057638 TaxID=3346190 RepID=UPI00368B1116
MSLGSVFRRRTTDRNATVLVATVTGVLLLTACGSGGTSGGGGETKFVTGDGGISTVEKGERDAAPDLEGETLDGRPIKLSDYRGKIVVVNVWASWCAPCRAEAGYLATVSKETRSRGVEFLGINTRDPQKRLAIEFEKEFGITYPSLHDSTGQQILRFPKGTLSPKGIPATVVVDREGRIAARALLAVNDKQLREMIDPLIAER